MIPILVLEDDTKLNEDVNTFAAETAIWISCLLYYMGRYGSTHISL